jgi:hypothetical protein
MQITLQHIANVPTEVLIIMHILGYRISIQGNNPVKKPIAFTTSQNVQ